MRLLHLFKRYVVPRGLFGRSLLIVLLPLLVLQVVLTIVFYERHWSTVARWLAVGVAGEVAMIVDMLERAPRHAERAETLDLARQHFRFALSFEPGGHLAAATQSSGFPPAETIDAEIRRTFENTVGRPLALDTRPDELQRIAIYVQLEGGLLRVLAPRKRIDSTTTNLFMLWMTGASALLLAIAIYFLGRQVRPIRRLAEAADSFGKGRDIGDFKLQGAHEIRQAGMAFNLMRQRILRQISQRTEMLAAVSHDLRTPLTRMRLELEMMGRAAPPGSDDARAVADLVSDVEEMTRLVEAYLAFARGEGREAVVETDLGELLAEVAERGRRNGTTVALHIDGPIRLPLRPLAFRRCLQNLVDNAGRFGRHVDISAKANGELVEILVDDDGPGIGPLDRDDVFKPFHRLAAAQGHAAGGIGLGLTIARDVVSSHGGDIRLGDAPAGGLRATLRLPS